MNDNEIKKYFGEQAVVYKFTGKSNEIIPLLINKGISVNYIVANDNVYLTCLELLTDMLDSQLSIFSTPVEV